MLLVLLLNKIFFPSFLIEIYVVGLIKNEAFIHHPMVILTMLMNISNDVNKLIYIIIIILRNNDVEQILTIMVPLDLMLILDNQLSFKSSSVLIIKLLHSVKRISIRLTCIRHCLFFFVHSS